LASLSDHTTFSVEVKQYQLNLISFLRMHRAVSGGITAGATKHFDKLAKSVPPFSLKKEKKDKSKSHI
jgi:hypothetical protein